MQNNITVLIFELFMNIIKIILKKFSPVKKKINFSEIQIFHPQFKMKNHICKGKSVAKIFNFTKKVLCTTS